MKVALMGHGVVGSGVAEILLEKKESLAEKAGSLLELVKILDLRDFPQLSYQELFTKDLNFCSSAVCCFIFAFKELFSF